MSREYDRGGSDEYSTLKKVLKIAVPIVIGVPLALRCLTGIPAGHVGVKSLFGKVTPQEIYAGLHLKNPLERVTKMSIQTLEYTMSILPDEGEIKGRSDTISTLTKEGLRIDLDLTVLYKLNPEKASDIYSEIGVNYEEVVVRPKIRAAVRDEIAKYMAKDIYSEKRDELILNLSNYLITSLEPRGIIMEELLLRHVELPAKLADSIEAKLQSEQEAQRMEFVLEKELKESERKIVEAKGIAAAQGIINSTLTDAYLQHESIQAQLKMATEGQNHSTIYIPVGANGIPLVKMVE